MDQPRSTAPLPQPDHKRAGSPHKPIDRETGFDIGDGFERFPQRINIFSRSYWDDGVRSDKATAFYEGYFMPKAKARRLTTSTSATMRYATQRGTSLKRSAA